MWPLAALDCALYNIGRRHFAQDSIRARVVVVAPSFRSRIAHFPSNYNQSTSTGQNPTAPLLALRPASGHR